MRCLSLQTQEDQAIEVTKPELGGVETEAGPRKAMSSSLVVSFTTNWMLNLVQLDQ